MRILPARAAAAESNLTQSAGKPKIGQRVSLRLDGFMRFAIPQLTTILLVLHVGIGCCWHHAHACVTHDSDAHKSAKACPCESQDHELGLGESNHELAAGGPSPCGQDRHEHSCEGDRCTFVRSKPTSELASDRDLGTFSPFAAVTLRASHWGDPFASADAARARYKVSLPLRAHLLYGVLLI
jgi:hypothetical protein